jgi:heme/copper-type cytochrome/quinol oxidase subunit 3
MNKTESIINSTNLESESASRSPMRLGMVLFLISEAFLFGSLFWTYYYLRSSNAVWPPSGVQLDLNLALVNTFILLISSASIWWAGRAIRNGNERGLALGLAITVLLALSFLSITIFEWTHEDFRPWTSAYGSIFYTLTGFHALHVFGGIMIMLALFARTVRHRFSSRNLMAVEVGSLYWHYVDFIWLIVFTSLFIVR